MHKSGNKTRTSPPPTHSHGGGVFPPPGAHPVAPHVVINTTFSIQPGGPYTTSLQPHHLSAPPFVPTFVQPSIGPLPGIHPMPWGMPPGSVSMGHLPPGSFSAPLGSAVPPHAGLPSRYPQPPYAQQRLAPLNFVRQKLFTEGVSYAVAEAMATVDEQSANPVDFSTKAHRALIHSVGVIIQSDEANQDKESAICLVNEANAIIYRWNQARAQGGKLPLFYFGQSNDNQHAPDAFPGRNLFTTVKVTLEVAQAMQTIARWSSDANPGYSPAHYAELAQAIKTIRDFPGRFDDAAAFNSATALLDIANEVVRQWQLARPGISLPPLNFDNVKGDGASLAPASTVSASQPPETSQGDQDDLVSKNWPTHAPAQRFNVDPQDATSADKATHQDIASLLVQLSAAPVLNKSEPLQPSTEKKRPAAQVHDLQTSPPAKRQVTTSTAQTGPSPGVSESMPTMESPPPETVRLSLPAHELSVTFPMPDDLQPALEKLTEVLSEPGVYLDRNARKRQTDGVYQAFRALALDALRHGRRDLYEAAAAWTVQWVNDVNFATTQQMHTRQPGLIRTAREAGLLNEEIERLLASA